MRCSPCCMHISLEIFLGSNPNPHSLKQPKLFTSCLPVIYKLCLLFPIGTKKKKKKTLLLRRTIVVKGRDKRILVINPGGGGGGGKII